MDHTIGIYEPMGAHCEISHIDLNRIVYYENREDYVWPNLEKWTCHLLHHEFLHLLLYFLEGDLTSSSLDKIEWDLTFSIMGVLHK